MTSAERGPTVHIVGVPNSTELSAALSWLARVRKFTGDLLQRVEFGGKDVEMNRAPDFFLTSGGELDLLVEPRACWSVDRLRDSQRDDYMLVDIQPSLPGQWFGLGSKDISRLILSSRIQGDTLFPITRWPMCVYAARVVDDSIMATRVFRPEQVDYITKAYLYPTADVGRIG